MLVPAIICTDLKNCKCKEQIYRGGLNNFIIIIFIFVILKIISVIVRKLKKKENNRFTLEQLSKAIAVVKPNFDYLEHSCRQTTIGYTSKFVIFDLKATEYKCRLLDYHNVIVITPENKASTEKKLFSKF